MVSSGIEYPNNYSTGDMAGDVFSAKNLLNPEYDMLVHPEESEDGILKWDGREYIGMGNCSNQLFLKFKPLTRNEHGLDTNPIDEECSGLNYQMVEVVKNINRFESSIKHKSNVFSVVVENSNLTKNSNVDIEVSNGSS